MVLLINVDEKNQIMHTNVWPTMVSHFPLSLTGQREAREYVNLRDDYPIFELWLFEN